LKTNLEDSSNQITPIILNKLIAFVKLNLEPFQPVDEAYKTLQQRKCELKLQISEADDEIFKLLIKKNANSWEILKYSSILDPDFIPIKIFSDLFLFDLNQLNDAVTKLKELSLVELEKKDNQFGLKIHRTVKMGIKNYLETKKPEKQNLVDEILKKTVNFLNRTHVKNRSDEFFLQLKTVIDEILSHENPLTHKNIKAGLASVFGDYLSKFSLWEALIYHKKSLYFYQSVDSKFGIFYECFKNGDILLKLEEYDEASKYYETSISLIFENCFVYHPYFSNNYALKYELK
jgi:hypothetical protein